MLRRAWKFLEKYCKTYLFMLPRFIKAVRSFTMKLSKFPFNNIYPSLLRCPNSYFINIYQLFVIQCELHISANSSIWFKSQKKLSCSSVFKFIFLRQASNITNCFDLKNHTPYLFILSKGFRKQISPFVCLHGYLISLINSTIFAGPYPGEVYPKVLSEKIKERYHLNTYA